MKAQPWRRPLAPVFAGLFDDAPGPQHVPLAMPLDLLIARDPVRCARSETEWLAAVEAQWAAIDAEDDRRAASAAGPQPSTLEPLTDEGIAATVATREREIAARDRHDEDQQAGREAARRVLARLAAGARR